MLAAIAPAAVRRVNGLRRVAPLPGVGEWGCAREKQGGVDPAPLLVLWNSLVPQSRARAGPLWSRFLSSSASGSGHDGEGDGSGPKGAEGALPEAAREDEALKEEPVENESPKPESSGNSLWNYVAFHVFGTRDRRIYPAFYWEDVKGIAAHLFLESRVHCATA
jgi:hypothetical protein